MSVRFWTAAEILRGLDDAFAADKRPGVRFPVHRSPITTLVSARDVVKLYVLNSYFILSSVSAIFRAFMPPPASQLRLQKKHAEREVRLSV